MALARALANEPALALLDEPGASLDPTEQSRLEGFVRATKEAGTALIVATHNLAQAERLCERILYFEDGRIVANLENAAFFSEHAPDPVRSFVRSSIVQVF